MPIDELLRSLEADAAAERRALAETAEREAAALDAAGRAAAERRLTAALTAHRDRQRDAASARLGEVEREWRRRALAARTAMLERVRAAAVGAAAGALAGPTGDAAIERLVGEVTRALGDAPATLRCRGDLAVRVRNAVHTHPQLRLEVDDEAGTGVHAESDDGRIAVDATLEALFDYAWPALQIEALRRAEEEP